MSSVVSKSCEMEVRALHFPSISYTSITFPLVKRIGIRRLRKVGGSLDPHPAGGRTMALVMAGGS